MVREYAKIRGAEGCARPFYDYYAAAGWRDAENKPVFNWQQKFIAWQMREEREGAKKPAGKRAGLTAPPKPDKPETIRGDMDRMERYLHQLREEQTDDGNDRNDGEKSL